MANYDLTYEGNEVQKILDTGDELQTAGYIFRGEATPSTVPGTPTERVAYIGGPGTYTNFGSSITVPVGRICVFKYTGSAWSNQVIDTKVSDGAAYKGIATPTTNPGSPIGSEFYIAITAGTYTNFGNAVVAAGLNVLKYDGSAWSVDQVIAIDDEPTQGSDHLVKSGGVLGSIIQNGPAFDLSAYNAQGGTLATYADLDAALTALNTLPADFKKGGMSIKFVLSSDNKYVQYRLMNQSFSTNEGDWIKIGIRNVNEVLIQQEYDSCLEIKNSENVNMLSLYESSDTLNEVIEIKDDDNNDIIKIDGNGIKVKSISDLNGNPLFNEQTIDGNSFSFSSGAKFHVRFKLQMKNANAVAELLNILKLEAATGETLDIQFRNALPTALTSSDLTSHTGGYWAYTPCPRFNAGIEIKYNGTMNNNVYPDYGRRRNFLLGADAFSIWFKGDATLEANKDLRIEINATTVRIYHSNGGNVASYTKASYATMKALYDAMLADTATGGALENYELEWFNLDNLTPADLIQCDVPIVAEYDLEYYDPVWRAFPYYFTTVEKDRVYDCEFGYNETLPYFMIDGYKMRVTGISLSNKNITATFGDSVGSDVVVSDIHINVSEDKQNFPNIKMYYFEGVAEGEEQVGLNASQRRAAGLFEFLRNKGMKYLTMQEIVSFLNGGLELPAGDYFHIGHDDSGKDVVQSESIRNTYISHSIYPSIGMFVPPVMSDADDYKVLRNLGFQYHVHAVLTSENKNDTYPRRLTGIGDFSYPELKEARSLAVDRFISNLGEVPQMWDFHWVTETWNVITYLKNHGFPIMFGGNGTGSINKLNRFRIDRIQSDEDVLTYSQAESHAFGLDGTYSIMRS